MSKTPNIWLQAQVDKLWNATDSPEFGRGKFLPYGFITQVTGIKWRGPYWDQLLAKFIKRMRIERELVMRADRAHSRYRIWDSTECATEGPRDCYRSLRKRTRKGIAETRCAEDRELSPELRRHKYAHLGAMDQILDHVKHRSKYTPEWLRGEKKTESD